jgi:hypothetical protein
MRGLPTRFQSPLDQKHERSQCPVEIGISDACDDLADEQITDVRVRKPRAWRERQRRSVHAAQQLVNGPQRLASRNRAVAATRGRRVFRANFLTRGETEGAHPE